MNTFFDLISTSSSTTSFTTIPHLATHHASALLGLVPPTDILLDIHTPTHTTNGGSESLTCAVCGSDADGQHFGADACRACAAFFRRTVARGLKYVCRF